MNSMHERVLQALDSQLATVKIEESLTQMGALERHIDHYEAHLPPPHKLQIIEPSDKEATLAIPEQLKRQLSDRQQAALEELIAAYVEGGLQLLYGVGKLVGELGIYNNSQEMQQIDQDIKEMYDMPEGQEQEDESEESEENEPVTKLEEGREQEQLNNGNFSGMQSRPQDSTNPNPPFRYPQTPVQPAGSTMPYPPVRKSSISAFAKSFGRKKKAALSEQQIENLEFDLKNPNLTKQQIQRKYDISQSTLNRYVRRFREWEEEANSLHYQQKQQQVQQQPQPQQSLQQQFERPCQAIRQQPPPPPPSLPPAVMRAAAVEGRRSKVRMVEDKVIEIYKKFPNIYQSQVAEMLSKHFSTDISIHVVSRCLKNIQNKKRERELLGSLPSQDERRRYEKMDENAPRLIDLRFHFAKEFLRRNPNNLIFIDEIQYRNNAPIPSTAWNEINFAFALSGTGRLVSSKVKNRHFNVEEILEFLEEVAGVLPGAIIVLDCARIHKDERIKQVTRARGAETLYLPNYSPQFNPVESIFPLFLSHFCRRVTAVSPLEDALKIARQTVLQLKECAFSREVEAARHYVQMANLRQPLPFAPKQQ